MDRDYCNDMNEPWKTKPDLVKEDGSKWWVHESLTEYAPSNMTAWHVERDGKRTLVLMKGDNIIFEDRQLREVVCRIDVLGMATGFEEL